LNQLLSLLFDARAHLLILAVGVVLLVVDPWGRPAVIRPNAGMVRR
jgi:hypothetical protein